MRDGLQLFLETGSMEGNIDRGTDEHVVGTGGLKGVRVAEADRVLGPWIQCFPAEVVRSFFMSQLA